jgi:hypothetical protein
VFIITSTINTNLGLIHPADRFQQTLNTIDSIRKKIHDSFIILIDNSTNRLEEENYDFLKNSVDMFVNIGERKFCRFINENGVKGAGECYMLLVAFDLLKKQKFSINRIYKISGRYALSDSYEKKQYENLYGKYCFKTREKNEFGKIFLHSRMWSFCGSLIDDAEEFVRQSFREHVFKNITIEEALYNNIDLTKLIEFDKIHCQGYIAPWNILIND